MKVLYAIGEMILIFFGFYALVAVTDTLVVKALAFEINESTVVLQASPAFRVITGPATMLKLAYAGKDEEWNFFYEQEGVGLATIFHPGEEVVVDHPSSIGGTAAICLRRPYESFCWYTFRWALEPPAPSAPNGGKSDG